MKFTGKNEIRDSGATEIKARLRNGNRKRGHGKGKWEKSAAFKNSNAPLNKGISKKGKSKARNMHWLYVWRDVNDRPICRKYTSYVWRNEAVIW